MSVILIWQSPANNPEWGISKRSPSAVVGFLDAVVSCCLEDWEEIHSIGVKETKKDGVGEKD